MSQHDFNLTTADANTGPTVRAGINAMAQALASCSSGATEPSTTYAYQLWADTTSGYMKQRNAANTAWLNRGQLAVDLPVSVMQGVTTTSGGTSDAITLAFSPTITSLTTTPIWWRASAANATTAPTVQRDALVAKTLVKGNNLPLSPGDIPGAGAWMCSQYDTTLDKEVLLNPANGVLPVARRAPNFANSGAVVGTRATAGVTTNLSTARLIGGCDNIGVWASGGVVAAGTITQYASAISGTTGYAARAAGVTLTGSGQISHSIRMEAKDAIKYINKTASFSVKVDHDAGVPVNYTLVVKKANSADDFSVMTIIATSSATAVASATATTLTLNGVAMGACGNGIELEVQAACGAVTTKNFNCTEFYADVQQTAQPYDASSYEEEVIRCCRSLPSAVGAIDALIGQATSATTCTFIIPFKVCARITPTGLLLSAASNYQAYTASLGVALVGSALSMSSAHTDMARLSFTVASGLVAGNATIVNANTAAAYMIFTGAEL